MDGSHKYETDLVITDLSMSEMTGEVLSKLIRDTKDDIPEILMTGSVA